MGKTKTCKECKYRYSYHHDEDCNGRCKLYPMYRIPSDKCACSKFESIPPPTVGDKIRQMSNTDLAEMLVYPVKPININGHIYHEFTSCLLLGKSYFMREQAVAITEKRLNAPAGKDNNVPAKECEVHNGFEKCAYCGKPYKKNKKAQRFCSIKCKDKWWNRERAEDREYLHPQCEDNFNGEC